MSQTSCATTKDMLTILLTKRRHVHCIISRPTPTNCVLHRPGFLQFACSLTDTCGSLQGDFHTWTALTKVFSALNLLTVVSLLMATVSLFPIVLHPAIERAPRYNAFTTNLMPLLLLQRGTSSILAIEIFQYYWPFTKNGQSSAANMYRSGNI